MQFLCSRLFSYQHVGVPDPVNTAPHVSGNVTFKPSDLLDGEIVQLTHHWCEILKNDEIICGIRSTPLHLRSLCALLSLMTIDKLDKALL